MSKMVPMMVEKWFFKENEKNSQRSSALPRDRWMVLIWSSLSLTVKMLGCGLTRTIRLLISKIIEKLKGKAMKKCGPKISNCGLCHPKPKKSHSDQLRKQAITQHWKQNAERDRDWQRRHEIFSLEENVQEKETNEKIHWKHYLWAGMQDFWVDTLNCFK